jgi:predicted Rossmann fold flavoprotein
MKVAIIGGGAAGFFSAIAVKENYPDAEVTIFDKASKVLSKVRISGGGRCNLTNSATTIRELSEAYPRGNKKLKKAFQNFNNNDTIQWFESRAIPLIIQKDKCVFPVSQKSQSIIDCFLKEAKNLGIVIIKGQGINSITQNDDSLELLFSEGHLKSKKYDKVIVATGGSLERKALNWLENLNHIIEDPVPSLFTFNMPNESITGLMGIVIEDVRISIQGTKLKSNGPLLITHWGMSGPAVLKLSSYGARVLKDKEYEFNIQLNWINEQNTDLVKEQLVIIVNEHSNKLLSNYRPYALADRLWTFLLEKSELPLSKKWGELGKKGINKLVSILSNDIYSVKGKTTFKEEFVTCGGVSLDSINFDTMESRVCKNLYFAGEILDIDGITGGFNLQAAWTTGFIAGKLK